MALLFTLKIAYTLLHAYFIVPCEIYVANYKNVATLRVIKCKGLYLISLRLLRTINTSARPLLTTNKLKDSRETRDMHNRPI